MLKLETLVWAHMYEDTVHYSQNNSATLTLPHRRSLKIEPEIVFGLKQAIASESLDATTALESTEWLALGFEIIDCPFPEWKFQPSDFVASFGLHAALVIGERLRVRPDMVATSDRSARAIQGPHVEKRRVRGRRIGQEQLAEPGIVPG